MQRFMKVDINASLKRFNDWFDAFILEAIKPVAMLSMGLGTVAIFNLQGLAIQPWFVSSWAIVQAICIDGLFFIAWDRLFTQRLIWKNALAIAALAFIGLVLALVAIAINAVLGFQVLWAIADSQNAMSRLGISPALFTAIRAVLAVVVFVMISFVRARARDNEVSIEPIQQAAKLAIVPKKATRQKATVVTVVANEPLAIPEVATSHEDILATLRSRPESRYELIKEAMSRAKANGEKINMKAISQETGAGYSTVKLYAPTIKQELGIKEST